MTTGRGRGVPMSVRAPSDRAPAVEMQSVLQEEERARSGVFYRGVLALALITEAFIPFLGGSFALRALAAGLCTVAAVLCAYVLILLRKPHRYTPATATVVGAVLSVVGVGIVFYVGIFSAAATVLTLGVYFFGMSHSRQVAITTYATLALAYLVVSGAVASGQLVDVSLFSTSTTAGLTRWFQVVMSQLVFGLTFWLARFSRHAVERAVDRVNRAHVQLQQRDALLAEARSDLDQATRPGEGPRTGERVADYRLGALLGRGAMGEVYRATDAHGAEVAIKLLHARLLADPDRVKRFLREARAAAAVRSEHVPDVYASGSLPDGAPYLVMELLEGHDLGWHLRKSGRLQLDLVVDLCLQVSRALADVREAGIVHRDLKPANLFLTESLPHRWKVLDFGLSKILWAEGSLTKNVAVGTPAYMAPEQVNGPKVDHRADLYALAALAYRAVTGTPPFAGDKIAHVLYRVLYAQPASPAELAKLPVDVELVLAIGLAKERDDRFARAEEFADALARAAEGTLDDATRTRGWQLLRRHPWGSTRPPSPEHGAPIPEEG